jgi:hypothetical protein
MHIYLNILNMLKYSWYICGHYRTNTYICKIKFTNVLSFSSMSVINYVCMHQADSVATLEAFTADTCSSSNM